MVIFITSKIAYEEMENLILTGNYSIWLTAGVLEKREIEILWQKNIELSVFNHEVDTSNRVELDGALQTIREHHPGKNIWVQFESGN